MDSLVLFLQLLILLALMATGFIVYKIGIVDDHTHSKLSSLIVWVLNPSLMISGVIGKVADFSGKIILQNVAMVSVFYFSLFIIGFVFSFLVKADKKTSYFYKMELLFPNVGFMGVPLVRQLFGPEYVVLVAFYLVGFNVLSYTYGVNLAAKYGGSTQKFNPKKLINPGTVASLTAILIFALKLNVPGPIVSFVDYLGNTSITISMMIIGISLAKVDWKNGFKNVKYYIFLVADMIVIPMILILLSRILPFDANVLGVFSIMCLMPVASTTCMFAQEYGGDATECAKIISLTTICTCITAPLVVYITSLI